MLYQNSQTHTVEKCPIGHQCVCPAFLTLMQIPPGLVKVLNPPGYHEWLDPSRAQITYPSQANHSPLWDLLFSGTIGQKGHVSVELPVEGACLGLKSIPETEKANKKTTHWNCETAMIISYLQQLPAFLFYSVSSAALLARLAAESLRYDNLLEDPGT